MQQHPIPQNVTAYEFHLIGNMTLKQFIELGIGIVIAVFFFSTELYGIIKWPLIILSVGGGAAMAFMPYDGRPLDRMVIIFLQAIYAPTQYIWKKDNAVPGYFTFVPKQRKALDQKEMERLRLKKNINEYIETLPTSDSPTSDLNPLEAQYAQMVNQSFTTDTNNYTPPTNQAVFPHPDVRVRKMKAPEDLNPKTASNVANTLQAQNLPTRPQQVRVEQTTPAQPISNTYQSAQPYSQVQADHTQTNQTTNAVVNNQLPIPKPPQQPNMLVGMVLDNQNKIVDNAIIEIKDANNVPVRAMKSNQLGQFFSATPLNSGSYTISIEKPGYNFDTISIDLHNKKIPPLEIKASNTV